MFSLINTPSFALVRRAARAAGAILGSAALVGTALPAQAQEIRTSGSYWDWQLTSPVDLDVDVQVLVLDVMEVSASDIARVKARGVKTVCYVSVGTLEAYRDDLDTFPREIVGKTYGDWPDERFLDISRPDVLLPLMLKRFERCASLGFDAVEPDNMATWDNDTGFALTRAHQVQYNKALAAMAHGLGMEIAQKNAPDLIPELHTEFDFMIVEECFHWDFCNELGPYLDAGKLVLAAEYPSTGINMREVCAYARKTDIKFIFKAKELAAGLLTC